MQENYDVYVLADANNRVKSIEGTAFYTPEELTAKGYVKIDSGVGDKFMHCQGNYLPKTLMTTQGVYQYKLVDGKVVERTQKEIEADIAKIPPPPPSAEDRTRALETELAALKPKVATLEAAARKTP